MKHSVFMMALTLSCLVACNPPSQAQTTDQVSIQNKAASHAQVIDETKNLFQVSEGLFRSEQLTAQDLDLLKQHNIQTIVNLRYFNRGEDQQEFGQTDVVLINQPLKSWHVSPKDIAKVLHVIQTQQQQGGVLVHCYHGSDRTGLIIGMYRVVIEGWNVDKAKTEMMQGPYGFHTIWKNMPDLFNEKTIAQVKNELSQLQTVTLASATE